MKKTCIIVAFIITTLVVKAQVFLIDSFTLSATEGAYGIYANIDCNERNVFYFDMHSNNDQQQVQMKLSINKTSANSIDGFIKSLRSAQKDYQSWSNIAQANNVKAFSKDISSIYNSSYFYDQDMYFTVNDKWYEEKGVDLKCKFLVATDGLCYLVLESDYLTSDEVVSYGYSVGSAFDMKPGRWGMKFASSTTSVTRYCSGASLTFSSSDEIDMFIQKLYDAQQWKKKNMEQGKLFK